MATDMQNSMSGFLMRVHWFKKRLGEWWSKVDKVVVECIATDFFWKCFFTLDERFQLKQLVDLMKNEFFWKNRFRRWKKLLKQNFPISWWLLASMSVYSLRFVSRNRCWQKFQEPFLCFRVKFDGKYGVVTTTHVVNCFKFNFPAPLLLMIW